MHSLAWHCATLARLIRLPNPDVETHLAGLTLSDKITVKTHQSRLLFDRQRMWPVEKGINLLVKASVMTQTSLSVGNMASGAHRRRMDKI